jgi:D-alanyl-D-alanine carboxypeptidase (penicillin-binding protein 5/6)
MKSANDAAVVLAEAVAGSEEEFVRLMNDKAVAIGADDTRFVNANGLPAPGQHITAYDLAKIMRQAIKYPTIREIIGTRITEISTETGKQMFIRNTNKLLWSDDELLGGKTGYTRDARHCFVCAGERDKDTIIVALLGAPNRNLLWKESEELMGFGAKVLARAEEPVIYLTRSDADSARVRNASYDPDTDRIIKKTRHGAVKKRPAKIAAAGRKIHRSHSALAKKSHRKTVLAKKSHRKTVRTAHSKKGKTPEVARQGDDGPQG